MKQTDPRERYETYMDAVRMRFSSHPEERSGQAYFNALLEHDREFADEIRGGPLDPFYDSGKAGAMLSALVERWGL